MKVCELFLRNRVVVVYIVICQFCIEGVILFYIYKLCYVFFISFFEIVREFEIDFVGIDSGCYFVFVVWVRLVMGMFVDVFSKQVFDSKESFLIVVECVKVVKEYCQ